MHALVTVGIISAGCPQAPRSRAANIRTAIHLVEPVFEASALSRANQADGSGRSLAWARAYETVYIFRTTKVGARAYAQVLVVRPHLKTSMSAHLELRVRQ